MPYNYGDSFTDVDGTDLAAHTPDSETPFSWVKLAAFSNDDAVINTNRVYIDNPAGTVAMYAASLNPGTTIEFDVEVLADGDNQVIVVAMTDPSAYTGYEVAVTKWDGMQMTLDVARKLAGVTQNFEFGDFFDITLGTHTIKLVIDTAGSEVRAYCDGVLQTTMTGDNTYSSFTGLGFNVDSGTTSEVDYRAMELTSIGTPYVPTFPPGPLVLDRMLTEQTGTYSGAS